MSDQYHYDSEMNVDVFTDFLNKLNRYPLLTAEEERTLSQKAKEGCLDSRERMINSNMRLVVSIAKRYVKPNVPVMDLVQEGSIGLMRAVELFDPDKGFRFSTYATFWIKQSITKFTSTQRVVRIPFYLSEQMRQINLLKNRFYQEVGREPTLEEMNFNLKWGNQRLLEVISASDDVFSIDAEFREQEESGGTLKDFLVDHQKNIYDELEEKMIQEVIDDLLDTLSEREENVIRLRFGLDDGKPKTLEEISRIYGVTRERIRQVEMGAFRKLRNPNRKNMIPDLFW